MPCLFPLIPLPIKEAIVKRQIQSRTDVLIVSINSTSYKRSDERLEMPSDLTAICIGKFPLIPLPIKEAII